MIGYIKDFVTRYWHDAVYLLSQKIGSKEPERWCVMAYFENLESAKAAVVALVGFMKSCKGFVIPKVVKDHVSSMAKAIEEGRQKEATEAAQEACKAGRSILGAFLRYSVFDKAPKEGEGGDTKKAHFLVSLAELEECHYDSELQNGLKKRIEALQQAVREDQGGDFGRRIELYNDLFDFDAGVEAEQDRRDRVREVQATAAVRSSGKKKQNAGGDSVPQGPNPQRTAMIAARKAEAESLRGLL